MTVLWPRGQAVKTSPFHGGNTGSIPVGVICRFRMMKQLAEEAADQRRCI